jgi:hypothetical protein
LCWAFILLPSVSAFPVHVLKVLMALTTLHYYIIILMALWPVAGKALLSTAPLRTRKEECTGSYARSLRPDTCLSCPPCPVNDQILQTPSANYTLHSFSALEIPLLTNSTQAQCHPHSF